MKKILLFLFLLFALSVLPGWTKEAETVRVAFFPMPGFHQTHTVTGDPMGCDVDYMNRICQYTRWKIQYVPVNTWDDALLALERSEVDIVGSAQITPDRVEHFSYSADATGRTRSVMAAQQSNKDLVFEDFAAFSKLGVVRTWMRRQEFLNFARNRDFVPRMQEFNSTDA